MKVGTKTTGKLLKLSKNCHPHSLRLLGARSALTGCHTASLDSTKTTGNITIIAEDLFRMMNITHFTETRTTIAAEQKGEPMEDLVRRQDAIDLHCHIVCKKDNKAECSEQCLGVCPDMNAFLKIESAQQEKTGYWFFSTTDHKTHCSACKQSEWHGYIPTPGEALKWMPICPKCGARMKESEIKAKKVRPAASVELDYGNDGRDCRYYVAYKCPTCGKSTIEGTVACDRCGTFFDWSKKASIKEIRKIEWE